jgi:hypothetical protein
MNHGEPHTQHAFHARTARTRRVATVTVVAALALTVGAPPATAGTHSYNSFGKSGSCFADIGSQGRFLHDGDRFWIKDECADGHHAVLLGTVAGDIAPEVVVWATGGAGSERTRAYNVAEGKQVRVRACVGDQEDDSYWGCGSWERGTA